jgi:hypothetical protein
LSPTSIAVRAAAVWGPSRALVALRVRSLGTERGEAGREAGGEGGSLGQRIGRTRDGIGEGRSHEGEQSVEEMHFGGIQITVRSGCKEKRENGDEKSGAGL